MRLRADPLHKLPNPVLYRRAEALACCHAVSAATLLVSGSESPIARDAGQQAALMFPHSRRVEIDNAGHMLHFEAPAALAAAIESFLLPTL